MVLLFDRGTSTAAARRIAHSDWLDARLHLGHETELNHPRAYRHLLHFNTNNFLDVIGLSITMQGKQLRTHLKKVSKKTGDCLKKAAWQTCKCALWITCAPCLCCALLCLPRRQRRGCVINGELPEYARPQFPTPRPRALSLPLVAPQLEQWTLDQTQSEFMTKLPLEIRRMIYERTLGGASIHLATYDGKSNAMECWRDECRCDYFDPLQEKRLAFGMGLLRTCRVMCVH
jgi:hypothetical protein